MTKTEKEPLIKISKRQNLALKFKILLIVGAIFLSLVLGGVLLACLGYNPFDFYIQMLMGNFKNAAYLTLLVQALIPLLITSLGVSLAFKMRFWNIGAEGQFIVGAICAMTFALLIGDSFPSPLGTIIIVLAGAIGGGIYAVIVALLKVRFNTNETLMTLMLNYVALYFGSYMLKTDFYANQGVGVPTFKTIAKALWLTEIDIGKFTFDTSVFIALALVIILFFYFRNSKQGYELNVVGDSPNTAKYAGMKVKWIIVRTMLLSGALIGLAGALKVCGSGAGHTFSANGDVGWTAIIVAWLAKLNPIGIFIASLLMSILERGCSFARTQLGISSAMSDVLQGIILFSVLASDFFINYKVSFRKKVKDAVTAQASGDAADDDKNASVTAVQIDDGIQTDSQTMTQSTDVASDIPAGESTTDISASENPVEANQERPSADDDNVTETTANAPSGETGQSISEKAKTEEAVVENVAPEAVNSVEEKAATTKKTTAKKADNAAKTSRSKKPDDKKTASPKSAKSPAKKAETDVKAAASKPATKKTASSANKTKSTQTKKNGKGGNDNE